MLAIEPHLKAPPAVAWHVAEEGKVEPLAAARSLIAAAQALGAEVLAETPVKWLEGEDRVTGVMTDDGVIHADEVVVAAGVHTADLLDTVGVSLKLTAPAGLLAHSTPAPPLLNGLVMTPGLHLRQTEEGRIVAGTDFKGDDHAGDAEALAADLQSRVAAQLHGAETLDLDFLTVGHRPTPADGFPAVGRPGHRPGLYAIVTHSGITLAPALGRFAAEELLTGTRDALLAPYHPDRPALR
jgi:glycine/D-amino acid oxidase-like deaminating enzyme